MLASSHNADFHFRSNDMLQPAVTTKVLCNILWFVSNLKLNRVFLLLCLLQPPRGCH